MGWLDNALHGLVEYIKHPKCTACLKMSICFRTQLGNGMSHEGCEDDAVRRGRPLFLDRLTASGCFWRDVQQ